MPITSKSTTIKPNTNELIANDATSIHAIVAGKKTENLFLVDTAGLRLPIPSEITQFNSPLGMSGEVTLVNDGQYQADVTIQYETN